MIIHQIPEEFTCYYLQKPCRRSITIQQKVSPLRYKAKRYFISFPSVIFKIIYGEKYKKFREKAHSCYVAFGEDLEKLYVPPLPNIHWHMDLYHLICVGNRSLKSDKTLDGLCKKIISDFWQSQFCVSFWQTINYMPSWNDGLIEHKDKRWSFENWEQKTKADPLWVPDWKHFCPVDKIGFYNLILRFGEI